MAKILTADAVNISVQTERPESGLQWVDVGLLLVILIFSLLRMQHLLADFPTASIYADDWSWFTDEGWYASAALNLHQTGHWVQPGDWSPGIAMPVWPALAAGLFHFTGVSALALRRMEVVCAWGTILLAYLLGRRYVNNRTGLCVAALVSTSAILFFFSRMALLEEPLMMITLAAILLASVTGAKSYGKAVLLGALLGSMMLTKTTAVCLFPAALYPLLPQCKYRWRPVLRLGLVSCLVAGAIYAADRYFLVQPHLAEFHDLWFRYDTTAPSEKLLVHSFLRFFYRGPWAGPVLFPVAVIAVLSSAIWMRRLFLVPLFSISVLWFSGVGAFLIYHFYGPPRYFSLLTVPMCFIAALWSRALLERRRSLGLVVLGVIVAGACWNIFYILRWETRPQYEYAQVSAQMRQIIDAEPNHSHFVLGHGAAQLRLFTDLDGIDAGFGPATLDDKIATYHPGWFVSWNGSDSSDPETIPALVSHYRIVPRGSFPVFHDRVRNHLSIYELEPR